MRRTLIHLLLSATAFAGATTLYAADDLTPLKEPTLPMPTSGPAMPGTMLPSGPVSFYRPNRLDVWQNLAVDRAGRWVPRVALTPLGAFYPNGRPYPFLPAKQNVVMPYLLD
jgi:hypothetical protein